MVSTAVLDVPLPEGLELDDGDRELLRILAQAVVAWRHETGKPVSEIVRILEADGWSVRSHIGWISEARRGSVHERAVGDSPSDALRQLLDLTLLDTVEGCP